MFRHFLTFKGTIKRTEYGVSIVISTIIYVFIAGILKSTHNASWGGPILSIIILWFQLAQGAKRCHDRGKSGWYQLIPFYVFWMIFGRSTYGRNKSDATPKGIQIKREIEIQNINQQPSNQVLTNRDQVFSKPVNSLVVFTDWDDIENALKANELQPELLPKQPFKPEKTTLLNWNNMYFQFVDNRWVKLPEYPSDNELRGFTITKEPWSSGAWGNLYRLYVREQTQNENDSKGDFNVKKFIHSSTDPREQVKIIYKSVNDANWYAAVYLLFSVLKNADLVYTSSLRIEENSNGIILGLETPVYRQTEEFINKTNKSDSEQSMSSYISSSYGAAQKVLDIYSDKIVCVNPLVKAGFLRAIGGFPRSGDLDLGKFVLKVESY